MTIKQKILLLKNRKKYLEMTAILVERFKLKSDITRNIDDTIGYLEKEKIKIKYKVK